MKAVDDYVSILLRARAMNVGQMSDALQREMLVLYGSQINRAIDALKSGAVTPENYSEWMRRLQRAFDKLFGDVELLTKSEMLNTIRRNGQIHARALSELQKKTGIALSYSLEGIADEAIRSHFFRRALSVGDSYKTLSNWNAKNLVKTFEQKIATGLAEGQSWQTLRSDLTKTLMLEQPDLKSLVDKVKGKKVIDLRDFAGDKDEAQKAVKRMLSDMNRIAITEINNANTEADRACAERSPVIKGIRWQVSSRHHGLPSSPDICDVYAEADDHGLGAGVYYAETLPARPHPYCTCLQLYVTRPPSEWDEPKPEPREPKAQTDKDVEGILKRARASREIGDKEIESIRSKYNDITSRAHQVWNAA